MLLLFSKHLCVDGLHRTRDIGGCEGGGRRAVVEDALNGACADGGGDVGGREAGSLAGGVGACGGLTQRVVFGGQDAV